MRTAIVTILISSITVGGLVGCSSNAGTDTLIGAGGGAVVGGLIGSGSHSSAGAGALIGAGAGAIGGLIVGTTLDSAEKKKEKQERDAEAAREREYYTAGPTYQGETVTPTQPSITRDDVIEWTRKGVNNELIIDRIQQSRQVFYLTAADENMMRDARVSEDVIQAMKNTARR
ncbi:MAG TPA: hypothetical protein VFE58_04140 [Tepidisphaeraceae bacterium]|jgi:hypothetical protein|nr:hypothetical protein [Tepidisphaeraceae bacterium]